MNDLGQLVFTGISGTSLLPDEKDFIKKENIGGIVLFSKNYSNPFQLAELTYSLQSLRKEEPLYIAVDHEGGRVVRFKSDFTRFPSMYDLAQTKSTKLVYEMGRIMAHELSICGINLNLSPVCDIWVEKKNQVIGDRSFGHTSETVCPYVSSMIKGLQDNGLLACAKHFPGHGCTIEDSHFELPVVDKDWDSFEKQEFLPFHCAIQSGVAFMMTAHILVKAVDPDIPCSLSPHTYDILRKDFKFERLIITDDMQMKAVENIYGTKEAAVMAVKAGADIIEYRDMEKARRGLEGLKVALGDDQRKKGLSKSLVNEKIKRIQDAKKSSLKGFHPPDNDKIKSLFASSCGKEFLQKIREKIAIPQ